MTPPPFFILENLHPTLIGTPHLPKSVDIYMVNIATLELHTLDKEVIILSEEERIHAAHYAFKHLEKRYLISRILLRRILASYTQTLPEQLIFTPEPCGKLNLASPSFPLQFNLSHSKDLILYAISRSPVGIDVEFIRPLENMDDIVNNYFSPHEILRFHSYAEKRERIEWFYEIWTSKEAYFKTSGIGLAGPFSQVERRIEQVQSEVKKGVIYEYMQGNALPFLQYKPHQDYVATIVCDSVR